MHGQISKEQIIRIVPLKLLPLNERHYTPLWAQQTYCYRYLFNKNVTSQSYRSDAELQEWQFEAIQLMKEIKQIGIDYGQGEIVQLAYEHYGMTMPNTTNCRPTNIDDIMTIIEDESWYKNNKVYKQNIIYHLIYGITRSGMNGWLINQERKWLRVHQIRYNEEEVGLRKTKLRGFVYSIMNSKFSNSTIKLFKTVMQRKYGEFISVRKPVISSRSNLIYTVRNFLGCSGYVVQCKDIQDHFDQEDTNSIETSGRHWIAVCKKEKLCLPDIHAMVDDFYNGNDEDIDDKNSTFSDNESLNVYKESTNMHNTDKGVCVGKQPRLLSERWMKHKTDEIMSKYNFLKKWSISYNLKVCDIHF